VLGQETGVVGCLANAFFCGAMRKAEFLAVEFHLVVFAVGGFRGLAVGFSLYGEDSVGAN
jgi:hypothetical protein